MTYFLQDREVRADRRYGELFEALPGNAQREHPCADNTSKITLCPLWYLELSLR